MPSPEETTAETTGAPGPVDLASLAQELATEHAKQDGTAPEDGDGQAGDDAQTPTDGAAAKPDADATATKGTKTTDETEQTPEKLQELATNVLALAKEGKVPDILKALGLSPKGAKGIPAARFAELRKQATAVKEREQALAAAEKERESAWSAKETEFRQVAETLHEEVSAIRSAREALQAGSPYEAIKLAFPDAELDDVLTASVKEKTAKDPEAHRKLRALEQQLAADRKKKQDDEKAAEQKRLEEEQQQVQAANAKREAEYCAQLAHSIESEDPEVAERAKKSEQLPTLTRVLMNIQLREYNTSGLEISATEALERMRSENQQWSDILGTLGQNEEHTDQAGSQPENTDRAGSSPARKGNGAHRHTRAAQAKPAVPESHDSLLDRLTAEMKQAHAQAAE